MISILIKIFYRYGKGTGMIQVYFFYSILWILFTPFYAHAENFFDQTESDFKQVQADQDEFVALDETTDFAESEAKSEELLDYPGYNPAEDDCLLQNLLIQQLCPSENLPEEENDQEDCLDEEEPALEVHADLTPKSTILE